MLEDSTVGAGSKRDDESGHLEDLNMRNLTLLTAALSITACARNQGDDSQTAEVAADSTMSTDEEGSLLSGLMDGASSAISAITADQAGAAIVARAQQRYNPSGCVVATQSGTTVTL